MRNIRPIRPTRQMTPEERDAAKDRAIAAALAFSAAWRDEYPKAETLDLYIRFLVAWARVETNIAEPE